MDLIRLLRSLEEFLYELVGWLVFYPRTFWRILLHPGQIARYTRAEFGKDPEHRFADAISPVLMLILSVAIAHLLEMTMRVAEPQLGSPVRQMLFATEQGLLLTRSAILCVYALGAALGTLRRQQLPVNRDTLREPFSIQAFLACPFLMLLAIAQVIPGAVSAPWQPLAPVVSVAAIVWYLWARTVAFRALNGGSLLHAFGAVLASFLITTTVVVAVAASVIL